MKVLVLGGTGEARALAAALEACQDHTVVSSLAGRVRDPRLPVGEVRVGGFGGPAKLAEWLVAQQVDAVVDATHPFAERISSSAAHAAQLTGLPLLMLRRPGWAPRPGWHWVDSLDQACAVAEGLGERIFLTTGRQGLAAFAGSSRWFLVRCVDPPDPPMPARSEVLLDRGPYTVDGELDLLRSHRIDVLVTKDSGGPLTAAKLDAAAESGTAVVVVRRPVPPDVAVVETVEQVMAWLR
ncbi:cobalt-precorrin-6A reductase [Actinokineospora globicatena]|uniref:cobalt-precorrin-6A reductase n=1 Tax=Actinokineospora globicatena TaxID=103729 RepID=UPI0020A28E94|nr:cobalt-precorrin-6A reductase [Actinokineospora globicatena]MCP2304893.1 precorrin-6A/cobalt-precorrin-6A reductase [Actinokineospora globicatena]GLW77726.1 precorrin-6A reductase [Actinokineospora globicatena]GLW85605.1 precorrin-6A reductase [Actinokineospora globicatena]